MEGFISIADYAKQKRVSVQSVYKRLNTTLKPYVTEAEGKKWLSVSVFENDASTVDDSKACKGVEVEQPQADTVKEVLRLLEEQLKVKNNEIELLHKELEALRAEKAIADEHIRTQSNQLAVLLSQSQELQRNNQVLLSQKSAAESKSEHRPAPDPGKIMNRLSQDPTVKRLMKLFNYKR